MLMSVACYLTGFVLHYVADYGKVLDFRINRKPGGQQPGNNVGQKVVLLTAVFAFITLLVAQQTASKQCHCDGCLEDKSKDYHNSCPTYHHYVHSQEHSYHHQILQVNWDLLV